MFDITDSNKDALNLDTQLNQDMAQVVLCSGRSRISQRDTNHTIFFVENCMKNIGLRGGSTSLSVADPAAG